MKIKDMLGLMVTIPIAGSAIQMVGNGFTGGLKGIGGATQTLIGAGVAGKAIQLLPKKFK